MKKISVLVKDQLHRAAILCYLNENNESLDIEEAIPVEYVENRVMGFVHDVIIYDTDFLRLKGIHSFIKFRRSYPRVKIMLLGKDNEKLMMIRCMKIGVDAIVLESVSKWEFDTAIKTILKGRKYICTDLNELLLKNDIGCVERSVLSAREHETLNLILTGLKVSEMAENMGLNSATISYFKRNILKKLNVNNTAELLKKMNL